MALIQLGVALYKGAADREGAGSLILGHTPLEGLYDLNKLIE